MCRSILEQDSEPQVAPDGKARALHGSSATVGMCEGEYEWVNERQKLCSALSATKVENALYKCSPFTITGDVTPA